MTSEPEPDPRHAPIRKLIARLYAEHNHLPAPWTGRTGRALKTLLEANRSWPVEAWLRAVHHRFESEVNRAEDPVRWIPRLVDYARGPLDEFGKPKRVNSADGADDRERPPAHTIEDSSDEFLAWVNRNREKAGRAGYPVDALLKEFDRRGGRAGVKSAPSADSGREHE